MQAGVCVCARERWGRWKGKPRWQVAGRQFLQAMGKGKVEGRKVPK